VRAGMCVRACVCEFIPHTHSTPTRMHVPMHTLTNTHIRIYICHGIDTLEVVYAPIHSTTSTPDVCIHRSMCLLITHM
jgi:hypothetical protein